jgi:non-heme chloroperoxidase
MKFKVSSGLNIEATACGNSSDPLVILLHGGGQTRYAWGGTAEKLSQSGFYALAIDLRGHGDSDWSEDGDYAIESYREDLLSIIKQIGKPASLIGASLGGMISLSTAGDKLCQDYCNALVMVDIGIYPNEDGSNEILKFMSSGSKGFESLEEASNAISSYLPHREKPKDISGLKKNLRLKSDGKYYWHWDPKFIESRTGNRSVYREKQRVYANDISVPTLLIRGALSNVVTQDEVDDFLTTINHAEFIEIDKAAHMIAGDRNDIFANAAIRFLEKTLN